MPSHPARRAVIAAAILTALVTPIAATAQDTTVSSAIIPVANSPATIEACRVVKGGDYRNQWTAVVTVGNRTKHSLIAVDAQFVAYDSEGAKISQISLHFGGFDPIVSRDTGLVNANLLFDLAAVANNPALLAKVSCRVLGAQFLGNMKWQLGTPWPEPILSIEAAAMIPSGSGQGAGPTGGAPTAATPKFSVAVTNAWNDLVNGTLYIHDAITIIGGNTDVQIRATDLALSMTLAGGAKKQYIGLGIPAPQYSKINALGSQPIAAFEVDPAQDLGRLGVITIPAHGNVATTVTFLITDPVQSATDNRAVTGR